MFDCGSESFLIRNTETGLCQTRPLIISVEMTGISGALAVFGAQTSVWIEASLDSMSELWHQSSLTGYVKTSIQYIWQFVSSPTRLALFFSFPQMLPLSLFLCLPPLVFFPFFSLFLESPSSGQGPSIFPQSVVLKAEPLFPATGKQGGREGGRRQADFLAANIEVYVSVRKSRGDRSNDDRETVEPTEQTSARGLKILF